ncbi:unnamed protein product, partial [Polarella glacialis]
QECVDGPDKGNAVGRCPKVSRGLTCALLSSAAGLALLRLWSESELAAAEPRREDYGLLGADPRLARFSDHCLADVFVPEEESWSSPAATEEGTAPPALDRVLVFFNHGDSSPVQGWPLDGNPPPHWDCRPADLPRHWRLNKGVEFQAIAPDGSWLDRSFSPDHIPNEDQP